MINKIRKAIEINREINNYEEDSALHHCPFDNCEVCEFIFGDEIVGECDCPCHIYDNDYVKETVRKLIGEV